MAFGGLSSQTLTYCRVSFLLTLAFFVLKEPVALSRYSILVLLAGSFNLPLVTLQKGAPENGLISLFLAFSALSDLVPLLESNTQYFESVVPTRILALFGLAIYTYLGSSIYVANSVVFGYVFIEIWFALMIFSSLRDEKYQRLKKLAEQQQQQSNEEQSESEYYKIVQDVQERSEIAGLQ